MNALTLASIMLGTLGVFLVLCSLVIVEINRVTWTYYASLVNHHRIYAYRAPRKVEPVRPARINRPIRPVQFLKPISFVRPVESVRSTGFTQSLRPAVRPAIQAARLTMTMC